MNNPDVTEEPVTPATSASGSGYAAFYTTEDGKKKLKPEVVAALDEWGWRSKEWPTRETAEINAFISGWESAMRHNVRLNCGPQPKR